MQQATQVEDLMEQLASVCGLTSSDQLIMVHRSSLLQKVGRIHIVVYI